MTQHYDGDESDVLILKSFISFVAEHMPENTRHKRMSTSEFNTIVADSQIYFKSINCGEFDYNSFTCGIAFGMRIMTAPENEV